MEQILNGMKSASSSSSTSAGETTIVSSSGSKRKIKTLESDDESEADDDSERTSDSGSEDDDDDQAEEDEQEVEEEEEAERELKAAERARKQTKSAYVADSVERTKKRKTSEPAAKPAAPVKPVKTAPPRLTLISDDDEEGEEETKKKSKKKTKSPDELALERSPWRCRGVVRLDVKQAGSKLFDSSWAYWATRMQKELPADQPIDAKSVSSVFGHMFIVLALGEDTIAKANDTIAVFGALAAMFDTPAKAFLLRYISPMNVPRDSNVNQPQLDLVRHKWSASKTPLAAVPRQLPEHPVLVAAAAIANADLGSGSVTRPEVKNFFNSEGKLGKDTPFAVKLMIFCRFLAEGVPEKIPRFLADAQPARAAAIADI